MEVFLGTVMPFPYNFVPQGWMACNGQIVPIQSYAALFSLIGVSYGGNGTTNFGLPSLNNTDTDQPSRVVAGQGAGPGLTPRTIGEMVGESNHTLTIDEMAGHNHPMSLYSASAKVVAPTAGATLADPAYTGFMVPGTTPPTTLLPQTVAPNGGGLGHPNDQPALQLYYCICYDGIFPSFVNA